MDNRLRLEFPNLSCNESLARMTTAAFIMELDPTTAEMAEIKTAVSEAVTNAIIHAYKDKEGIVRLEGELHGNTVCFIISDNGVGIENIKQAMTPLYTGAPDMERSGMGFTIMEEFMDDIVVKSTKGVGTTVILTKQIDKGEKSNE